MTIKDQPPPPPPLFSGPPNSEQRRTISNEFVRPTLLPAGYSNNVTVAPGSDVSPLAATAFVPSSFVSSSSFQPVHDIPPPNFSLPVYSTDLGRLPVYGQFNFLDTIAVSQQEIERQIQMAVSEGSGHYWNQQVIQPIPMLSAPPIPHVDMSMPQSGDHDHNSLFPGMTDVSGSQVMPLSHEGQWDNGNIIYCSDIQAEHHC